MNAKELLEAVQWHKSNCVQAMISGDVVARHEAEAAAKTFLIANYAQVLDIMDDALTAGIYGGYTYDNK